MKKRFLYCLPVLAGLAMLMTSCYKEPTVSAITETVNGYQVSVSVVVTDADTYLWEFGDGTTSAEAAPTHTYTMSGNYTVKVTVTGRGGEATTSKQITILPSVEEMLTGGPSATNGKTWVLSTAYTAGVDGGSVVDNDMFVMLPTVENVLTVIGLGDEYDNEFTFYSDGTYKVDVKNSLALTAGIFGYVNGITVNVGNELNTLGIYAASYTPPASATWTLHSEDLVVDAIVNPLGTDVPAPIASRTITGRKWVSISGDAYFGILDFPTTRKFIIKEITPDKMDVALFICGYFSDPNAWTVPTYLYHLTYVPKN